MTLRPRADVPALVVEIYDGSRPLHLVWLGRREIAGIQPGVSCGPRAACRTTGGRRDDVQPVLRDRPEAACHAVHRAAWLTADGTATEPQQRRTQQPTGSPRRRRDPQYVTVEELLRDRLPRRIGGWRGAVESALPTVAFVIVWTTTEHVRTSLVAAGAALVVLALLRLVQRRDAALRRRTPRVGRRPSPRSSRCGRAAPRTRSCPGMLQTAAIGLAFPSPTWCAGRSSASSSAQRTPSWPGVRAARASQGRPAGRGERWPTPPPTRTAPRR